MSEPLPSCTRCGAASSALTWRPVTHEQALVHALLWGGGMYLDPRRGRYLLPTCQHCIEKEKTS